MPNIDPKVALMTLNFYCNLILGEDEHCDIMESLQGDSLMNRCIRVIAKQWQEEICDPLVIEVESDNPNTPTVRRLPLPPHAEQSVLHRSLPPLLQRYLLEECLLAAKNVVDSQKSTVETFEQEKNTDVERSNENVALVVKQMQLELEKSKMAEDRQTKDNQSQIEQLQQRAEELEAQLDSKAQLLEELKQELTCFHRVPGIHNFGEVVNQDGNSASSAKIIDKTKCTYSANPDHHYPKHRRGSRRPTQMPSKGSEFGNLGKENGYLYDDSKGELLPMFYYHGRSSLGSGDPSGGSA